jgi:hypothetical protein
MAPPDAQSPRQAEDRKDATPASTEQAEAEERAIAEGDQDGADTRETYVAESMSTLKKMYDDFSNDTIQDLYLAERNRRLTVRSQLAVPASVISFAIFGYIAFARSFDVSALGAPLTAPLTAAMFGLFLVSVLLILVGAFFLARLEYRFMKRQITYDETPDPDEDERTYLIERYTRFARLNDKAANDRARAFVLIVVSLGFFVLAVVLLPFHLAQVGGGPGGG